MMRRALRTVEKKYAKKQREIPPQALQMIFPLMVDHELPNYDKPPEDPEPNTDQWGEFTSQWSEFASQWGEFASQRGELASQWGEFASQCGEFASQWGELASQWGEFASQWGEW
eukprot:6205914-Pyramimonas_sp.AAC.1